MEALFREFKADVERTYGAPPRLWRLLAGPWIHAGLRASLLHRLAHRCHRRPLLRLGSALLKRLGFLVSRAEIHPAARIGGGLHLPHPQGVVIGPTVTIDGQATVFQDVVLGARGGEWCEGPRLAVHTFVYPGARILGKVRVGARSQVGPNCVIYRDLPEGSTVLPPEPLVLEGLSFSLRFECPRSEPALEAAP